MKNLVITTCFVLTLMLGCSKEDSMSYGQITNADYRLCMCCGGWFINIGNETYRFLSLPENSDLNLTKETLPINVELDWTKDENACLGDEIIISSIRKR